MLLAASLTYVLQMKDEGDELTTVAALVGIPVGAGLVFGGVGHEVLAYQRAHPDR